MNYTLDSITQVKQSLEEKTGKTATITPIIIEDITEMASNINIYFGVLTLGNNFSYSLLKDENDNTFIKVDSNSQIIDFFSKVESYSETDVLVNDPQGHFRGFEISLR